MPIKPSELNLRSNSFSHSKNILKRVGSKRSGDVLDSLVFMIVGLLLPAWILGHLFLTFYPAPEGGVATEGDNLDVAAVSTPDNPELDLASSASGDLADSSTSDNSTSTDSGTEADAARIKLNSMKEKFHSLTETSGNLETEVASLKQTNTSLLEENATLKQQVAQAATMPEGGALASDNSAAMNELQSKYDSAALQLETANQNLNDTTTRLESTENEKRTLQQDLTNATSKLEQANADLAAAVAKNESSMEIKPESGSSDSPFSTLESEKDSPQTDLAAEANAKVSELEQKLKELTLNLNNTNNAMATQKNEMQSAQSKLQSAQSELQTAQSELQTAQSKLQTSQTELQTSRSKLQTLVAQNGDLKTALNTARQKAAQKTELPKEIFRDFVSSKGSISKMAFIRWEGEAVIVRSFANKKLYRLTMDRFSDADKQYLLDQKK